MAQTLCFNQTLIRIMLQSIFGSLAYNLEFISTNSTKMPPKSTAQKTTDYFTTVEAGDIALFDVFDEAIAMFGFTKVGKTTSGHFLTNSTLRSKEQNGDLIYEPAGLKYPTAKIGFTNDSETEIPNIFEYSWKDDKTQAIIKVTLLDQPGYGDSYGFHRILSNGYFHYRSFSKTPKLKFILAFNKTEMKGTATVFTKTIFNFMNSFTNYNEIKHQILAATTFLVTQVEHNSNLANIINIIKQLRENVNDQTEDQRDQYQEIIDHMIKNQKIFIINKPAAKGTQTVNTNMLQEIYAKTKFWIRNIHGNVVDMSNIKFSVAKEILISLRSNGVNKLFNQDYAHFMNFMNQRINDILINHPSSLKNLIQILINDSVGEVNTHSFLETMRKFNVDYYKFDEKYNEKRKMREANLFKSNELNESNNDIKTNTINNAARKQEQLERERQIRSAYFVKKFKVLQFVIQKAVQISDDIQKKRTIKQLEAVSIYFIEMFKKMSILRWQRDDPEKIIYKYTYIIQRMIEEAKIITLILFNKEEDCSEFENYNSVNKVKYADIYRKIQDDVFTRMAEIQIPQLKERFCENIDITTLDSINQQIVSFFESCPNSSKVTQKIINLLIRYSQMLNHKKRVVSEEEKKYVAYKIFFYRNLSLKYLKQLSKDDSSHRNQRKEAIQQIFRLSIPLASTLTLYTHYDAARAIYQSIHNADMTFKIFEMELKTLENNPSSSRKLLIEYGKYAATTHRKELAMKCYQQAYSKSFEYDDLMEVAMAMEKLTRSDQYETEDAYIKNIFNQNFCLQLSPTINEKIELIFSPNEEPSL